MEGLTADRPGRATDRQTRGGGGPGRSRLSAPVSRPRIAGVQCMTVPGYSKGLGYQPGQSFSGEFDHAWNAVFLEGRWHLVDSTWGSGLVDSSTSKFTFL